MPILDTFLGVSDKFPENEMKILLNKYRANIPEIQVEYLHYLKRKSEEYKLFEYCQKDPRTLLAYLKCADGIRKFRESHFNLV